MKLTKFTLLFATFAGVVLGLAPQKAVVVTYPQDTPESVISEAKDAVIAAVCRLRARQVLGDQS